MADPLWTESAAHARILELLAAFDRNPDVLSPDEQALVRGIRTVERAGQELVARQLALDHIIAEMQAESDAVDAEAERNSIDSPEYLRLLRNLGLTARHFLRERRKLFPMVVVLVALLCSACGSSSPTAPAPPTPVPTPTPTPVPTPVSMITVSACPDAVAGLDVAFYREIGCNAFDLPLFAVKRWAFAPKLYIRTVDEAGAAIDQVTIDTVAGAMSATASAWAGGKFGLASIERGTDTREGVSGWITVKWPATAQSFCGQSQVAVDGGLVELSYKTSGCGCSGSSSLARVARHELGHAFGYWHTDSAGDLMSNLPIAKSCDQQPSARELAAAAYQYR